MPLLKFPLRLKEIDEEDSERGSEGEELPPKRKKRMAKTNPANIEEGSNHEEEATPFAPPPARKKKVTVVNES